MQAYIDRECVRESMSVLCVDVCITSIASAVLRQAVTSGLCPRGCVVTNMDMPVQHHSWLVSGPHHHHHHHARRHTFSVSYMYPSRKW